MKLYTKEELIKTIQKIINDGWHKSVKRTIDKRNDGAVGNTLESLLGIKENNLPLPNARFEKFLDCAEKGYVLVDFDARTGHNHGTKFRLKQDKLPSLYETVTVIE